MSIGIIHMRQLTMKQHRFVDEYINTGNASESYRRSYDCKNSTNRTIQINASKLLNNTMVALAINVKKNVYPGLVD
jgi:phage terminase small subunit